MNPSDSSPSPDPVEMPTWFLRPQNVRRVIVGLAIACGLLVLVDLVVLLSGVDLHPHFGWERWPGFYAVFGFVMCSLLVLVSRFIVRPLVMREENYYQRDEVSDSKSENQTDA